MTIMNQNLHVFYFIYIYATYHDSNKASYFKENGLFGKNNFKMLRISRL